MASPRHGWRQVRLKEVCRDVTVGHVGPMATEYVDEGVPFLRSQNVQPFRVDRSTLKYISREFHAKLRKSSLSPGDVVVVRTGYPGTACVIPDHIREANCADLVVIRPSHELDALYLAALFNSVWGQGAVAGKLVGAAQQHFNIGAAREMLVDLPPRQEQQRIASMIGAYCDLIENNTRRVAILEEMARSLYREWFVEFRFPGHEKVTMVESELGPIPEGWEVAPFTEIADVLSGGTPQTKVSDYWEGDIPFFTPRDVPDCFYVTTTEKALTELGLAKCNSQLYPKDTVFVTARGTVGKVVMPARGMAMNQSCYALKARRELRQEYLFLATLSCVDYLKKNTGGATFDTIVVDTFRRMFIVVPPVTLANDLAARVESMFALVRNLLLQGEILRATRDLLLPRLISGEISLAQTVGEAAEATA